MCNNVCTPPTSVEYKQKKKFLFFVLNKSEYKISLYLMTFIPKYISIYYGNCISKGLFIFHSKKKGIIYI